MPALKEGMKILRTHRGNSSFQGEVTPSHLLYYIFYIRKSHVHLEEEKDNGQPGARLHSRLTCLPYRLLHPLLWLRFPLYWVFLPFSFPNSVLFSQSMWTKLKNSVLSLSWPWATASRGLWEPQGYLMEKGLGWGSITKFYYLWWRIWALISL